VVIAPVEARIYSFVSPEDSKGYFVSLVEPMNPEVGANHFEVVIHKRESMMSWPTVENFMVEIEPVMPSMGHGSPGNINPVHTEMGHYVGEVNFTMTGYWMVNMTIKDENSTILDDSNAFDITF